MFRSVPSPEARSCTLRRSRRRAATFAVLALLAASAHLVLPLVYTCRSYDVRLPSCCDASRAPDLAPPSPPSAAACPFCTALSPFHHARFTSTVLLSPRRAIALQAAASPTVSVLPLRELGANPARAPPSSC